MISIPLVSVSAYAVLGNPNLPGVPRAERLANVVANDDFVAMVAQVEAHLADDPRDAQGWLVLANAHRGMDRYAEAAEAFGRLLQLVPPTAPLLTDHGEALVASSDGMIAEEARQTFVEALAIDGGSMKARFYLALADRQEGREEEARRAWRAMLAEGPADAPWRGAVERQIASLETKSSAAPRLGEDEIARAEGMVPEDRRKLIGGMVEGLARRLEHNGKDLQGWLRLARARLVLGETQAAAAALRSAEVHFNDDQGSLALIEETRKALGLGAGQ